MRKIHRADSTKYRYYALCGADVHSPTLRDLDKESYLTQRKKDTTCKNCIKMHTLAEGWNFESGTLNMLLLRRDTETKMAEVYVNGKCVYLGNYWDYHNGCHGVEDFKFSCISSFLEGLRRLASREGMEVQSLVETYRYNG